MQTHHLFQRIFPALAQAHVELVTTGIERVTSDGIVTTDAQERAIDILIGAIGSDVVHPLSGVNVVGLGNQTL